MTATTGAIRHLLLYDGVCGLCNRLVRWVLRVDRRAVFGFASLQSGTSRRILAAHGKAPDAVDTVYVVVDYRRPEARLLARSDAALFLIGEVGWPRLARLLAAVPAGLRDWAYDRLAATRYRVFGRHEACPLPEPRHRARFVDLG